MKVNKSISLPLELIEKLKLEPNASETIQVALTQYYDRLNNPYADMTQEERDIEREKLTIMIEAKNKIKELELGRNRQTR